MSDSHLTSDLLDRHQVAIVANVSERTARTLFERRAFPTVRILRRVLVRRADLDAYIEKCTRAAVQ